MPSVPDADRCWQQNGGAAKALPEAQEAELRETIAAFTTEIMKADTNKDGKLSKEEFLVWATQPETSIGDKALLTKWMDVFSNSLANAASEDMSFGY